MRPRRLFARIYFYTLGVLLVVGFTVGGVFSQLARPTTLHGPAERVARRVAERVGARLDDPKARAQVLRELAEEFEVDLTIRDAEGRLLEAVGPVLPALEARDREALPRGPFIVGLRRWHGWFVAMPLFDQGGQAEAAGAASPLRGVLEVSLMRRLHTPSLARPAATVALVLLVVAIATLPLSRRITRPVEEITFANQRLGAGDLGYRIPLRCDRRGRHRDDELRQLQRSWNEMAGRIEALVRSQRELLANVSHELRSPLSRVRVALALLPEDPALQARLRDIEGDLGELERLIDDVLTTSRLEASGLPLRLEAVRARALLAQVAERGGAAVRVEGGPELELFADGPLLKRALWNLVENALKYGAPPVTLSAARAADGGVIFRVCDEGPGVPAEERARVLEPFYRADKARTPGSGGAIGPGGFGLGLTLARRVAEVHGGELSLSPARREGDREIGLCVTLRVPARPSSPASPGR